MVMAIFTCRWAVFLTVAGVWKVLGIEYFRLSSQGMFRTSFSHSLHNFMPMGEMSGVGRGLPSWPSPSFLMLLGAHPTMPIAECVFHQGILEGLFRHESLVLGFKADE